METKPWLATTVQYIYSILTAKFLKAVSTSPSTNSLQIILSKRYIDSWKTDQCGHKCSCFCNLCTLQWIVTCKLMYWPSTTILLKRSKMFHTDQGGCRELHVFMLEILKEIQTDLTALDKWATENKISFAINQCAKLQLRGKKINLSCKLSYLSWKQQWSWSNSYTWPDLE